MSWRGDATDPETLRETNTPSASAGLTAVLILEGLLPDNSSVTNISSIIATGSTSRILKYY